MSRRPSRVLFKAFHSVVLGHDDEPGVALHVFVIMAVEATDSKDAINVSPVPAVVEHNMVMAMCIGS